MSDYNTQQRLAACMTSRRALIAEVERLTAERDGARQKAAAELENAMHYLGPDLSGAAVRHLASLAAYWRATPTLGIADVDR